MSSVYFIGLYVMMVIFIIYKNLGYMIRESVEDIVLVIVINLGGCYSYVVGKYIEWGLGKVGFSVICRIWLF